MAVVTAPTPPGTGVMASTIGSTSAKRVSPQRLPSAPTWMPTSSTIWPARTLSAPTMPALPAATTRISASRQMAGRFSLRLWQMVTVACSASSSRETGLPMTRLRPITTTRLPLMGTL